MSPIAIVRRAAATALLCLAATTASAQDSAPAAAPASKSGPAFVRMTTNKGEIVIELDRAKAPITVENFLGYTRSGFYDGTVFHRVIPTFMIQGGGFNTMAKQKQTDKPIRNEGANGLSNSRGTIAMARTNVPDSATSQFFINVVDNPNLDTVPGRPGYAVFGKVVKGMEVVDAIRAVQTGLRQAGPLGADVPVPMRDWPVEEVVIEKVVEITPEEAKSPAKPATPTTPAAPKAAE
ncbi:MAG: peptidylprolyl isomerase [Phycisphaerales bacterium]|jgi:peptidyl-prolyl cis-trans isomerase A (cyclophilin A)